MAYFYYCYTSAALACMTNILLLLFLPATTGVLNPGCECVTYQGHDGRMSGTFNSPGYPLPYSRGTSCILYEFIAPPNRDMIVEIIFTDLDIGNITMGTSCRGDKLKLYLHQSRPALNDLTSPDTSICGNMSMIYTNSYYSSGRILILELDAIITAEQINSRGFRGVYNFLDAGQFRSDGNRQVGEECIYYVLSAVKRNGKIFSPHYPQSYSSNMNCAWIFKGDLDERIHITFIKIELAIQGISDSSPYTQGSLVNEFTHPNRTCDVNDRNNDLITLFDGDNEMTPVLARFCGRHTQEEVTSTGRRMMMKFSTNKYYNMQGFAALYQFVKAPPQKPVLLHTTCDQTFNSTVQKRGTLTSLHYPNSYTPGTTCIYTFHGAANERVVIEFIDFDLDDTDYHHGIDDCNLRDKLTVRTKVNDSYVATLKVLCGSQKPLSMMSNGAFMQLEFQAQAQSPDARGFNISFKFVNDFGIRADEVVPYLPCVNRYRSSYQMSGVIISPNYPGLYPLDTSCTYIFDGQGKRVMINFTHFDVIGEPPACLEEQYSDYVSFSNFYLADDKQMYRYCGNDNELPSYILGKPVISDTDFFRINFKSGMTHMGTGFRATYTFIDTIAGSPAEASNEELRNQRNSGKDKQSDFLLLTVTLVYHHVLIIWRLW